jgi:hypothetical protein
MLERRVTPKEQGDQESRRTEDRGWAESHPPPPNTHNTRILLFKTHLPDLLAAAHSVANSDLQRRFLALQKLQRVIVSHTAAGTIPPRLLNGPLQDAGAVGR